MDKKFLTQYEALSQFGLDAEQFQQMVDDGKLRALADRGTWKFRRDEIEGLIQEGLLTAKHPAGDAAASASLGAGPDDFSFLELDEDALSEGATMVKKSSDLTPAEAAINVAPEMTDDSSGEVGLVADSASDLPVAESLDEVTLADASQAAPVVLEADAAIVADSDSDVNFLEDAASQSGIDLAEGTDHVLAAQDSTVAPISPLSSLGGSDSNVRIADSGISLEGEESALAFDASGILAGSGIREHESGVPLRPVDSGISLEADSGLTLEGSNVDSGLALEGSHVDSGLTLEGSNVDSGISPEAGDSGITVDAASDSGIKLGGSDSGITAPRARATADETQPEFEVSDNDFAELDQTAMIAIDDDDDAMQTLPPTKRAGKKASSLSESFDTVDEVEDLEIAEDLDAGELDVDAVEDDDSIEDVLEASDEAFTMEEAGELSEDSVSAASLPAVKPVATREPTWGIGSIIPVAAVALLLAVNSLMLWDAMSTMWRGNTDSAISSGIIEALGGLI